MRPGLLGERDEVVGADEAALRVVPAHERLDGVHPAVVQDGLGLVVERQLALLERAPQLADEGQAAGVVGLAAAAS